MMARFVKQGKNQRVGADEGMVRQSPIHANDTAAGPNDRLGVDGRACFVELEGQLKRTPKEIKMAAKQYGLSSDQLAPLLKMAGGG